MAVLLFYSPFIHRSRDTESLMVAFQKQGHRVISLSQESGKDVHEFLKPFGIETFTNELPGKKNILYFLRQLIFFVRFCKKNKIDVVYSHLEQANYVAAAGQYFVPARVLICRHHVDEAALYGFDRSFYYKATYALARTVIVVSEKARDYMIRKEKINSQKIVHINLAYDFTLYPSPSPGEVNRIRAAHRADLLLVTACRLTAFKRPDLSIDLLQRLLKDGIQAKLILLGRGELESKLKLHITENHLETKVIMPGYVPSVLDFFAAADFLVHPSVLESSCVVIKEAGLVQKPVIICRGIGDFDSYMKNEVNGFLVDPDHFVEEASRAILQNYIDKSKLSAMGVALNHDIQRLFSIENVIGQYDQFNKPSLQPR